MKKEFRFGTAGKRRHISGFVELTVKFEALVLSWCNPATAVDLSTLENIWYRNYQPQNKGMEVEMEVDVERVLGAKRIPSGVQASVRYYDFCIN